MNIYITLDYELFFGKSSGTLDNSIIKPTEELLEIIDSLNIKANFFVDAGYLVNLEMLSNEHPQLKKDYQKITQQIKKLAQDGHSIELHIHPHWEDSYYDGNNWIFDTKRYKLSDFSEEEINTIVEKYAGILYKITGSKPKAYRAGGWSAQPFNKIAEALKNQDIYIDSTVFPKGYYNSKDQYYNFRNVPQYLTEYRFSDNLTQENQEGFFTEIPISSVKVKPYFFWKFAYHKLLKQEKHQAFGDGQAIAKTKNDTLRLMTSSSYSVVSIDGYKSSLVEQAFYLYKRETQNKGNFVIIGHPKAFTRYSLEKLKKFLLKHYKENHHFKTF